jgi:hypothetical protein
VGEGGGPNPPYGEDMFQRIVGVHWRKKDEPEPPRPITGPQQWLLGVSTSTLGSFNPVPEYALAANGQMYGGMATGASGAGFTVLSAGFVTFGTVRFAGAGGLGETTRSCFLVSDGNIVEMGVVKNNDIEWTMVYSPPGAVLALSFAGDAFFVTYAGEDYNDSKLAFSVSGDVFQDGISAITIPMQHYFYDGLAGNVAYNNGVYAVVGNIGLADPERYSFTDTLCWATSGDGTAWGSGYNLTQLTDPGGTYGIFTSNIAAGGGVFMAATGKTNVFASSVEPFPDYSIQSCAYATSIDGQSWATHELAGAVVRSSHEQGDRGGCSTAITYVSTGKDSGYFVVAGQETGGASGAGTFEPATSKLWVNGGLVKAEDSDAFSPIMYTALSTIDANPDPKKTIFR